MFHSRNRPFLKKIGRMSEITFFWGGLFVSTCNNIISLKILGDYSISTFRGTTLLFSVYGKTASRDFVCNFMVVEAEPLF